MLAGIHNFTCEQGSTFSASITLKDSAGASMSLVGYTARMQVRKYDSTATTYMDLSTANGALVISANVITITVPSSATASLAKSGVYDLEITSSGGIVSKVLNGEFRLAREVTR